MSTVDDLKAAKAAIEARGWYQGGLTDGQRVCAVGALNLACIGKVYPETFSDARRDNAWDALTKLLPEEFTEVSNFNDHPSTTKQDVLDLFDKALAGLGGLA